MPCPKTRFPRGAVPPDFGKAVREARERKKWSRSWLARRVGVTRQTIIRLEDGKTSPGAHLVRALTHPNVFCNNLPWIDIWDMPAPDNLPWGFLAHEARRASGQRLREVAEKAGCSIATLSSFERHVLLDPRILGIGARSVSETYAAALGFDDAADMLAYLEARDVSPWLDKIAAKFGRPALAPAHRPLLRPQDERPDIDLT